MKGFSTASSSSSGVRGLHLPEPDEPAPCAGRPGDPDGGPPKEAVVPYPLLLSQGSARLEEAVGVGEDGAGIVGGGEVGLAERQQLGWGRGGVTQALGSRPNLIGKGGVARQ